MSDRIIGPYYDFKAGDILKADHLNQMQQNIANEPIIIECDFSEYNNIEDIPVIDATTTLNTKFYLISEQVFSHEQIENHTSFYANYNGDVNKYIPFSLAPSTKFFEDENNIFSYGAFNTQNDGNYLIVFANIEGNGQEFQYNGQSIIVDIPTKGIYIAADDEELIKKCYVKLAIYPQNDIIVIPMSNFASSMIITVPYEDLIVHSQHSVGELLFKQQGYVYIDGVFIPLSNFTRICGSCSTVFSYSAPIFGIPNTQDETVTSVSLLSLAILFDESSNANLVFYMMNGLPVD